MEEVKELVIRLREVERTTKKMKTMLAILFLLVVAGFVAVLIIFFNMGIRNV